MSAAFYRWSIGFSAFGSILMLLLIGFRDREALRSLGDRLAMKTFASVFFGLVLEALPFLLLGIAVSTVLQNLVTEGQIRRWIPRHPVPGILFACLLGIVFPLCECGMVPVVRRLIAKGMPVYVAVVFLTAGPVLNPIVFASTYMAFRSRPEMAYTRMGMAFAVAASLGFILYRYIRQQPVLKRREDRLLFQSRFPGRDDREEDSRGHGHGHPSGRPSDHSHDHAHGHNHTDGRSGRWLHALSHAADELFDMGKYLLIGALVAAAFQTFASRSQLLAIGHGEISSNLFMLAFAYVLSLCSTTDAFVASSFASTFSGSSLLTFLVFGPMINFKNTMMLFSVFRTRFVLSLILVVAVLVLAASFAVSSLPLGRI